MTSQAEKLLEDAMSLHPEGRAALASALLSSLEPSADEDAAAAWRAEVKSRLEEIDSGQVQAVSWEEARPKIFGTG